VTFVGVLEVKDIKLKLVNFGTRKNSEDIKMSNAMSDSLSSTSSEPRMLERRISNQRAELTNDQQMNYLLAWFNNWSDLQKEDFIPVLAEKLSSKWAAVNGVSDSLSSLTLDNNRPPSLFQCQVKLFTDWVVVWSDDQKNYFIIRLKDIDPGFSKKFEHYLEYGKDSPDKDYFEPGVPPELDHSLTSSSETREIPQPKKISFKDPEGPEVSECKLDDSLEEKEEDNINLKNYQTDDDLIKPNQTSLTTIEEDPHCAELEETEQS